MALGPQEMEDPATGRRPSTCAIKSSSKALLEFSCEIVRERTFMIRTAREVAQYLGVEQSRSEEHTSELQSHSDLVCRLLLEKKKKITKKGTKTKTHTT